MINLLPDEFKKQIVAGRSNVKLVNYILILMVGIMFLASITAAVYFVIQGTKTNAENLIAANRAKSSSYSTVQAQADGLRASLTSAQSTLARETLYTKVVTGIAAVMPSGVVLQTLALSPATLGTPITLQAYAKTTDDALKFNDNFRQSPLFTNVSITSLDTPATSANSEYPVTINISVTINKGIAL
jgi:Tfp pilus assembly protein PilN